MNNLRREVTVVMLGSVILLSGVAGLFLPFMPGILLICMGVLLIATVWKTFDEWLEKNADHYLAEYPDVKEKLQLARKKINNFSQQL